MRPPWGPPVPPSGVLTRERQKTARLSARTTLDLRAEAQVIVCKLRLEFDRSSPFAPVAARTWRRRMVNEYSSSRVFECFSAQMREASCAARHVTKLAAFAEEERGAMVLSVERSSKVWV